MARVLTKPASFEKIRPFAYHRIQRTRSAANRKHFSPCVSINDKIETRRFERFRENQRLKSRGKSRIFGRSPRDFSDKRVEEMSQIPLISRNAGMPENNSRDLVILEVGPVGDTWRYSIERERLAEKSEWFRALLLGGLAPPPSDPPPTVPLERMDKRAFDHLLKYLKGEPVNFYSVSTARSTLEVAHQLLCPELARNAVDYIIGNLTSSTVLGVYHGLELYVRDPITEARTPRTPSAPPAPGDDHGEIAVACSRLLAACHNVIDTAPDEVFRQEYFEELSPSEVVKLASRDDLHLLREGVLFDALDKWSAAECRRQGLEPIACNRRTRLSEDVWYKVRYLLMTSSEFIEGPMHSGIFTGEELSVISTRIFGHHHGLTNEQVRIANRLSSTPRNRTRSADSTNSGKKEREDNKRNRRKECATQGQKACARIGDCIVRVLACVFD